MKYTITFVLLFLSLISIAQRPAGAGRGNFQGERPQITLKGQVIDQVSGLPLEFATISIFSKKDSSLISGGLTELDGSFALKVPIGPMRAEVEYISFEKLMIDPIPFDREAVRAGNRVVDLGQVGMSASAELLNEVEITAEKSETQFSLDKRVFNVGKDLANRGGTAEDILDNVPSVTVDIDGGVSLRGSDGVRILIDGRPSTLANADNANGLRSIPANMIEKVEVITNPSARYEAEGMAGILNIVLKKQKGGGFNGSFDVSGGYPTLAGVGANVNYRKGKVNWFANYGLRHNQNPGQGFYNQRQTIGSDVFIQEQTSERKRNGLSNSIRFGIDFFPREKETITGSFLYRQGDENSLNSLIYNDFLNTNDNLTTITTRVDDEHEDERNLEYSLNYSKEYSSRKHKLNATLQFNEKSEGEYSDFLEQVTFFSVEDKPDVVQNSANDEAERNLLFQVDFTRPLPGDDHQYELGARANLRDIDNDYLVQQLEDGEFFSLPGLSNNFEYDEDVFALYGIYGKKFNKIGFQAGLRAEQSHVITNLKQTNELNDRNYFGVFPSMHVNYAFAETNQIQISYSRRIRRPRFWDLNPFFTFSDSRNTFSGNPNLDPEYTDSYEVGNIRYFENGSVSGSFFYRHTTDVIQRILTFQPDGTTNRQPENLAERDAYGLELTFQFSGVKWWRVDGNANFFRSMTNGQNVDANLQADTYTWFARMTNRFTFWDGADLQLRFNYRAPRETTQGRSKAIAHLDLGLSKDVTKDLTLTAGVRDLFNSRRRAGETIGDGFYRESEFQWRSRQATIALNYRVNQKKRRGGGRPQGGFDGGGEF